MTIGSRPSINSSSARAGQGRRRNAPRRGPRSRVFNAALRSLVWLEEQKTSMIMLLVGVVMLLVLFLGLFPALLAADASAFGKFPNGASICGVKVGDLTRDQAVARCEEGLAHTAATPFALTVDGEVYAATPAEIGLNVDYPKMVDEAYARAWNVNIVERMARRFLDKPKSMDFPPMVVYNEQQVQAFVNRAMPSINCPPRNAYMDVSTGNAAIVPARDGRKADYKQVLAETNKALANGRRTVDIPLTKRTPPKIKDVAIGKFILVNQGAHTLSLYDRDKLLARYPVCVGSPQWPTVIGEWAVVKAEKNPTWYNRGSTWAEHMPPSLPPGPGNPLGTRAITLNGGGVLIHGTPDGWSIGRSVSHGCIRMYISDVERLYEHVYIGMPVYIIKAAGNPGFDCSKPPFWK
jgi:lipoprotein-anchoring transpeptidase ErfK/SrfK